MNIIIRNSSDDPIYLQIKNQIRDAILNGDLDAEEQLPSIRLLAKELRISVITTKRAYDELEQEGFIHSVQGKGSFVAQQNRELMREKFLKKIESCFAEAIHYAKLADISREELGNILELVEENNETGD